MTNRFLTMYNMRVSGDTLIIAGGFIMNQHDHEYMHAHGIAHDHDHDHEHVHEHVSRRTSIPTATIPWTVTTIVPVARTSIRARN